ncbi:MAG TPA: hypothetical protein DIV79_13395 [Opitutae bacterium]|nr:hypothetical protein [Opitutaceae bacterium]HCR31001.1 hypothetical protein [Opitutae bacterium]
MEIDAQDAYEINFYEKLRKRLPGDTQILELLAGLYSKYDMDQQALRIDRKLARLSPKDPRIRYNLACSLSLSGRTREALSALKKAVELGYNDAQWLEKDRDLKALRGLPEFIDLVEQIKSST